MQTPSISKEQAVAAFDGSQAKLARALGISRQAVSKVQGDIPELWAMKLRYELRPDLFPPSPDRKAA